MLTIALICTHNGASFLNDQVQSILNQTLPIDSIVIYDFNSMDLTRDIIKEISLENPVVSYRFFDFAVSACHSFLHSISLVKEQFFGSEYLLYLCDQDDAWISSKNKLVTDEISKGAEFVFHDVEITDVNLVRLKSSFYQEFWEVERDFSLPSLFLANCVIGHTIAVSSSFLEKINLEFDSRIPMHDWYLSLLVLKNSSQYKFISKSLSLYRQHDSNILGASQSNPFKKIQKAYRHGPVLILYQQFLLSKGFETSTDLKFLFSHTIRLKPISKKLFILLCLFFSLFRRTNYKLEKS